MVPGDVPKWLRGGFAKPVFTGSNPVVASIFPERAPSMTVARRQFWAGVGSLLAQVSCSDPPPPPPAPGPEGLPRWSTAPYVEWSGPRDPVERPLAVFIDQPGGPLDQIAADPDVTSFLNDRFSAWFLTPAAAQGLPSAPAALWLDIEGCLLAGPARPSTPEEWIAAANDILRRAPGAPTHRLDPPPRNWTLALPEDHALRATCSPRTSESSTPPERR